MRRVKIWSLGHSEVYSTVSLTLVTMLGIGIRSKFVPLNAISPGTPVLAQEWPSELTPSVCPASRGVWRLQGGKAEDWREGREGAKEAGGRQAPCWEAGAVGKATERPNGFLGAAHTVSCLPSPVKSSERMTRLFRREELSLCGGAKRRGPGPPSRPGPLLPKPGQGVHWLAQSKCKQREERRRGDRSRQTDRKTGRGRRPKGRICGVTRVGVQSKGNLKSDLGMKTPSKREQPVLCPLNFIPGPSTRPNPERIVGVHLNCF